MYRLKVHAISFEEVRIFQDENRGCKGNPDSVNSVNCSFAWYIERVKAVDADRLNDASESSDNTLRPCHQWGNRGERISCWCLKLSLLFLLVSSTALLACVCMCTSLLGITSLISIFDVRREEERDV